MQAKRQMGLCDTMVEIVTDQAIEHCWPPKNLTVHTRNWHVFSNFGTDYGCSAFQRVARTFERHLSRRDIIKHIFASHGALIEYKATINTSLESKCKAFLRILSGVLRTWRADMGRNVLYINSISYKIFREPLCMVLSAKWIMENLGSITKSLLDGRWNLFV